MKADFPKRLLYSSTELPVKLLTEMLRNSSFVNGGKSDGKLPLNLLLETSKYFKEPSFEMGFKFPEILHFETSRSSNLLRFPNPEGKTLKSLFETSSFFRFNNPEILTNLVNRLSDKLRL
uniref:Uncharacterized protein n=1 Tax=Opuntia streptacantha TaxID=393608 RepID=A0A7C9E956_OPUST